ncbi:MAG TPA: hypothetical protein DEO85_14925 [Maritimibacter sp.]|nr:hypothetical protein [Maritimibacter sp.]
MTYDRKAIMTEAWEIVRRFLGNGETLAQLLSRALKAVWWSARQKMRVAQSVEASMAAKRKLETLPSDELAQRIENLENRDVLGASGLRELSDLRSAHVAAQRREIEANEAKREMIASAKGRFCHVVFTKKDGSARQMTVQPAALKNHVKGADGRESARRAAETRAERHPHLMPVWDVEKQACRTVNLATVNRIAVNGAVHEFHAH